MAYLAGNIVKFDVAFTDSTTGAGVNPTTSVNFTYALNGTTENSFTLAYPYTVTTPSATNTIYNTGTGTFEIWIDTTGLTGVITAEWQSYGSAGKASVQDTITVGTAPSSSNTFGDLIEKVYRRTMGSIRERAVQISAISSNATSVTLTGAQITSIMPGVILGVDMEIMYVTNWTTASYGTATPYGTATVIRGYNGSTAAPHAANTVAYINPRYSRFDIGIAINDDLRSLSSPSNGLFRVGVAQLTYNPVFAGYDLGALPDNFIDILEIRYRIAPPYRTFPAIKRWKVLRWQQNSTDPVFPSGKGLVIYESGWPGLPIYVTYSAPFIKLVNLTDSVLETPTINDEAPPYNGYANAVVPNLTATMVDLPPLGAEIDLTQPREISRNFIESQPDPRKAAEIVAGAVAGSVNALVARRAQRISEEADRLTRQYTKVRAW
jgi:hypothetical protein